jgi:ribosome-associated protein
MADRFAGAGGRAKVVAAMADSNVLRINGRVSIPVAELTFRASRSGGPGGQHVNTSSTRIELWWDLAESPSLSAAERSRAWNRLGTRLLADGRLRLVSSGSRSQLQNREEVVARFRAILAAALREPKPRKRTRPTQASRERRLAEKKEKSRTKRERRPPSLDD